MKLYYCRHKEDLRDTWYEMALKNGNKMGIVYRGHGQMEFWGGRLSENAERTLLFDTDNRLEELFNHIHTVCAAALGEKEHELETAPTSLWFAIVMLMSRMEGLQERAPGLFERNFKGYADKYNKHILEAQKSITDFKITVTASGKNETHSVEDRVTELECKVEQIMPTTS